MEETDVTLEAYQERGLVDGGDTLLHYHLADRGPFPIPCANFYDTTQQNAVSTTVAYPMTLNTEVFNNIVRKSGSKFYAVAEGIYNIQFSCQLENSDSQTWDAEIWLAKNGSNVTESSTIIAVPAKHGSTHGHCVAAWNFFERLASGDYFELMWRAESTAVYMPHRAATTSPARPSVPSIILTINLVSI